MMLRVASFQQLYFPARQYGKTKLQRQKASCFSVL